MTLDHLAHIRSESARFAEVLRRVDPADRVPSCPDWSAADLAWHLTEVHAFWAAIVAQRLADPGPAEAAAPPRPPGLASILTTYEQTTDALLAALEATPDDTPVWTWASQRDVGFVRRFQAHEALIHRVDAELTAGLAPSPLPTELAADGIDVVLRYGMTWRPDWARWTPSDAVGLLTTSDTPHTWGIRLGTWGGTYPETGTTYEGEVSIEVLDSPGAATPTFTVSGPAGGFDGWLWNRPGFTEPALNGDAEHLQRFRARVAVGMP